MRHQAGQGTDSGIPWVVPNRTKQPYSAAMRDPSTPEEVLPSASQPASTGTKRLALLAIVAAGLIAGNVVISLRLLAELERRAHLVSQTLDVQRAAELLLTDIRGAGRQVLDSVVSGDAAVGVPLSVWRTRIETHAGELRTLVSDNTLQARRAAELDEALKRHVAYLEGLLSEHNGDRATLLAARRASAEQLEQRISVFLAEEANLLGEREAAWNTAQARQAVSVALLGALALATMAGLLAMWRRLSMQRAATHAAEQQHVLALADLNAGLEAQVRERTASLERSAAALSEARERLARVASDMLVVSESERRALAHALHDDFGQRLAALKINLQLMHRRPGPQDALSAEAIRITEDCIAQVRAQAFALRPPQLDELGLVAALQSHVQQEAARCGVRADVQVDMSSAAPGGAWSIQVYRIVQEAVRNALTHGRPGRIEVELRRQGDDVVLRVVDDGHGSLPDVGSRGMGLLHMQERAELSGGRFATQSRQPHGTEVLCRWPIDALPDKAEEQGRA